MHEFLCGTGLLAVYFIVAAGTALGCRMMLPIPDELFRKILHCILLGSLMVFVSGYETWWIAALVSLGFAAVVYPLLAYFERFAGFSRLTTERKTGELKHSLLLVFGMFAAVMALCWGALGERYLVLASIYAWGFGDAAAALVGKRIGKHKIHWKHTDGKKSAEGSAAMFLLSFLSVMVILALRGGLGVFPLIIVSFVTALVAAAAELYSKDGNDTVICPLSAMAALLGMLYLFGGLL